MTKSQWVGCGIMLASIEFLVLLIALVCSFESNGCWRWYMIMAGINAGILALAALSYGMSKLLDVFDYACRLINGDIEL